jgi:hypothetical protein
MRKAQRGAKNAKILHASATSVFLLGRVDAGNHVECNVRKNVKSPPPVLNKRRKARRCG